MLAQNSDRALPKAVTNTWILPRKIKDDEKNEWNILHTKTKFTLKLFLLE